MGEQRRYHHGDLRRALLAAAVEMINEVGPAAMSLRGLARRAGVSHAAPQHHFGDKAGLLTALAREGFEQLVEAYAETGHDLLEMGVAYVRFAVEHRAHFQVMFQPALYHADDPQLVAARAQARDALDAGLRAVSAPRDESPYAPVSAWSIAHGFAALWLGGALPPDLGDDAATAARHVLRPLYA